jgi:predicted MFS family arabinose efflux permease
VAGACIGGVSVNFPMLLTGRILVGAGVGISIQVSDAASPKTSLFMR